MKSVLNKLFRCSIGFILILLGLFSAISSTYATIIPLIMSFEGITKSIMMWIFIIVQISVFFLAMIKNYIARETPQHYTLINRIANFLMLVSIFSTITFFGINRTTVLEHQKSIKDIYNIVPFLKVLPCYDWIIGITVNIIFIWSVCIILDVLAIKMPLIGFDIIMSIKEKRKIDTLTSKLIKIVTHRPIAWVNEKYNDLINQENLNQISSGQENEKVFVFESRSEEIEQENLIEDPQTKLIESAKTEEEDLKEPLFEKKIINLEHLKIVFDYIIENLSDENIAPGMGRIVKDTEVNSGEAKRIRNSLIKFGYLQPDLKQTIVLKKELNLNDFKGEG